MEKMVVFFIILQNVAHLTILACGLPAFGLIFSVFILDL